MEFDPNLTKPTTRPLFTSGDRVTINLAPYEAAREAVLKTKHAAYAPEVPPAGVLRVMSITVGQDASGASLYLYRLGDGPEADRKTFVTIPEDHLSKVQLT